MIRDFDLVKDLRDRAFFVDQEGRPVRSHVFFPIHAFLSVNPILVNDLLIRVGDEYVRKVELRNELLMGPLVVGRDPYDLNILLIKFGTRIPERTCLLRSARCIVFWIEPKHDTFAAKIFQAYRLAILVAGREFRCLVAFFQHNPPKSYKIVQ